jgi:hypothetical protein
MRFLEIDGMENEMTVDEALKKAVVDPTTLASLRPWRPRLCKRYTQAP